MRAVIEDEYVLAHRARGMNPESPVLRGTSQNPDVFFAARETVNKYYMAAPGDRPKVHGQVCPGRRPAVSPV